MALGIGGCTVAELKARMSYDEAVAWAAYRRTRGPLNPMMRADANAALIAASVFNAAGATKQGGGQFKPADFMQWADEQADMTIEGAMKTLVGTL